MKLTIFNLKGGVGKTAIALNLALTLDFSIVTNELHNPLEQILPDNKILKLLSGQKIPDFQNGIDLIFDFGGFLDERVVNAFSVSDWIIIPTINESLDLQTTVNLIQEIEIINNKILIVINKAEKNDFNEGRKLLKSYYDYPVFEIKKSRALPNIINEKKSIHKMCLEGGLKAFHYSVVKEQFIKLIGGFYG